MMKTWFAASAIALVAAAPANAAIYTYTSAPVTFVDGGEVISPIVVAGLTGTLTNVAVTLNGFSHTYPSDMVFGLFNTAANRGIVFMSGAGGSTAVSNINLAFSDSAAAQLPAVLTSGTYRPSNYDEYSFVNGTTITSFAGFAGLSPNATWNLIVDDVAALDTGRLAGGYTLTLTTTDATAVPEPTSWALMLAGVGAVGLAMRRRTRVRLAFKPA